jgi:glycosyltransferase involved in cell wall biosynthesis
MKILFLTPRDSGKNFGGVERHVRILRKELEKRGYKVKELSLDEIDEFNKGLALRTQGQALGALGYKFQAWRWLWRNRSLFKWANVIHVHDVFWWIMPFAIINKGLALLRHQGQALETNQGRLFVTFHGWEGVCPPSRSAVWQKRLAAFLSDGTIGVGNFFKKWYGIAPSRVVYGVLDPNISIASLDSSTALGMTKNSPDCHVRQSRTRNDRLSVVFLGRLEKVNGIEVVIEVIKRINKGYKDYKNYKNHGINIFFVGDGSYRKQAEKFGKVTGMVKNPQKYLIGADAVITSSYMSMLEAAAMGKPIIAIRDNQLKGDYLNCHPLRKYIVICKNSRELARRIASLQFRKDAIRSARDWALRQTPEKLASEYEKLWSFVNKSLRS